MMEHLLLLKGADIFSPAPLGLLDILVAGGKIIAVGPSLEMQVGGGIELELIDCAGLKAVPGLIDGHVHVAGAGGEGGPATRTPEVTLSQLLAGGITTVIGCLGTDGYTRSPLSVLMKVKALRAEGVSSWMLTGAYQVPPPTITGDVGRDLALIEEVIGVGEVAISDHRASFMDTGALIDLASKARVGGMLGGKAGIVQLHMGDAENPLRPIHDAVEASMIPLSQFMPTHMNRNAWIFEAAKEFGRKGGRIDLTASSYPYFSDVEIKPSIAVRELLAAEVPLDRITLSSDGNGSLPGFDDRGNLVRLDIGQPSSIYTVMVDMVVQEDMAMESALSVVTRNPARTYRLPGKGEIGLGYDADIVLVDEEWQITHLLARGRFLVKAGVGKKGTFEP